MSKTIELKKALNTLLKTVATRVFYEEAAAIKVYPYVVFELSEIGYDAGKTLYQLEVNALDYGSDTTTVETLADDIQELLNKYYYINTNIQFSIYKGIKGSVKESEKEIIRRRLLFEVQLHELKGE